jgi:hypothetical protein
MLLMFSGKIGRAGFAQEALISAQLHHVSKVSIEPLNIDRLDELNLPAQIINDARHPRAPNLPVILIRCKEKPGAMWILRLPEKNILVSQRRAEYQTQYEWVRKNSGDFSYEWQPISWENSGQGRRSSKSGSDAIEKGKIRCRVHVATDSRVHFEITYKNESHEEWGMPGGWVCLIHKYSGAGESYYVSSGSLVPTRSVIIPDNFWLIWFSLTGKTDFADACRRWMGDMIRPGIADWPELIWKSTEPDGFQVRIRSEQAAFLEWSRWPCTDMALLGKSLKPGKSLVLRGYVEMGWEH